MSERIDQLVPTDQIKVELTIRLGCTTLTVAELSALAPDDIITLDRELDDGVEICVGDRVIATGALVADDGDGRGRRVQHQRLRCRPARGQHHGLGLDQIGAKRGRGVLQRPRIGCIKGGGAAQL